MGRDGIAGANGRLFGGLCWPLGSSGPVPALVILDMRSYHETLLLKIGACLWTRKRLTSRFRAPCPGNGRVLRQEVIA